MHPSTPKQWPTTSAQKQTINAPKLVPQIPAPTLVDLITRAELKIPNA